MGFSPLTIDKSTMTSIYSNNSNGKFYSVAYFDSINGVAEQGIIKR